MDNSSKYLDQPPVIIGGIGGSGTRLIAQIIKQLGFFIGSDLNSAFDNLWFTLLFKNIELWDISRDEFKKLMDIFLKGMVGRSKFLDYEKQKIIELAALDRIQHSSMWLKKRSKSLIRYGPKKNKSRYWGWKEPNTHIFIDHLISYFPKMKYIHVVRNGLDMAYSKNQNQLELWGKMILKREINISPNDSLCYWCAVHERILKFKKDMGENFLFLNFDKFCTNSDKELEYFLEFLEFPLSNEKASNLKKFIKPPESIGRFRKEGIDAFSKSDILFVKKLGFDID